MSIKVLIVDDSMLIRRILREIINSQHDMEVVGEAPDPLIARTLIKALNPDVLTLDVEMPKMDGLNFLEKLMRLRPMPVVMISTLTEKSSVITMQALELGAVDFITKPKINQLNGMQGYSQEITDKIRAASMAKIKRPVQSTALSKVSMPRSDNISRKTVIAIGASTGGTEAISQMLRSMPKECPAIVIAQHMPAGFTASFASRLNSFCTIEVKEAKHNECLSAGTAYIAPGNKHLCVIRKSGCYYTQLNELEPVNRHRPSVDVLFESVASNVGENAIGIILTGMGKDGAAGLLTMKNEGAFNFSQDEQSCVVYGMPREALLLGGVDQVEPLNNMVEAVLQRLRN
ncbi:protein-glutamate methylesterase/protein-glutamine glutaminase [Psychromonas ossibalaenae]|uniref:protein-glutamate methylesterase/protein-glutamine glutaminase n=1 Tax=Psychromonas ossibalaenae TaxID=444922 RepID=UPI00036B0650|nr:chemotaxis response regulator protein-glutamate methylesterase [Psychromonas ossibalaenae]